jgi:hypothetical protein
MIQMQCNAMQVRVSVLNQFGLGENNRFRNNEMLKTEKEE